MSASDAPPPGYSPRQGGKANDGLKAPNMSDSDRLSMEDEERPVPEGWIRQFDKSSKHHFYVDTKANPPRSIWTHPFDDQQWQQEHASKVGPPPGPPPGRSGAGPSMPAPATGDVKHPIDEKGGHSPSSPGGTTTDRGGGSGAGQKHRGFLGKLKDDIVGTKEEREAAKRKKAEEERAMQQRYLERRQQLLQQQQHQYPNTPMYANYGYQNGPQQYAPPQAMYGRRPGGLMGGGMGGRGGGGLGLPLLGGLAGGMLLGDMMGGDGFGGDGGGFGGDGGGFGGDGGGGGDFGGGF